MSGTTWVPGAEFLEPAGAEGAMLGDAPARVVWHTTEAPSGSAPSGRQYFDAMAAVLRAKKAEPHLLWDPVTDRLGQFFPLDAAARAVKNDAVTGCRTNRTGTACIQIEVVAQAANPFTSYWSPGPNFRALMAAARSWGIPEEFPAGQLSRAGEAVSRSHETWMTRGGHYGHTHVPGNCVHPDTKILCADLSWKRAGDLVEGDELVGFDEDSPPRANPGRRYRLSTVLHNEPAEKPSYLVTTTQGTVTASEDHPWLVRHFARKRGKRVDWVATKDLDPEAHRILSLGEPWEPDTSWAAGWMAGAMDADGHLHNSLAAGTVSGIGQLDNEVLDLFMAETERRGCTTKVIQRAHRGGYSSKKPFTDVRILGGLWATCRLMGIIRPVRLLPKAITAWQQAVVGRSTGDVAVLSVTPAGLQPVASLTTSTATYVADGLLCHNTHWDCGFIDIAALFRAGAPDWEEDFMASIHDKVIASPIPGDNNKLVSVAELLMFMADRINTLEREIVEARDGRLGNDLRKSHNWLKNFSWGLGEHLAAPGDADRSGRPLPAGGRFLAAVTRSVRGA